MWNKPKGSKNVVKGSKSQSASSPVETDGLTGRRLLFVQHYLEHPNGAAAARLAGFKANRADTTAADLLADAVVSAEIARRQATLNKKFEINQERVLAEISALAFSDVTELVEDGPGGVPQGQASWPMEPRCTEGNIGR